MFGMALEGVRVIDVSHAWAGPVTTRALADMGAEVIKVESMQRMDSWRVFNLIRPGEDGWWNRSSNFNTCARNKYGITLDLTRVQGVELFKRLVKLGDIVVENFTPRVMENLGLHYPVLKGINPSIIMMSMPAFGMSGPWRDYAGFAATVEQFAGIIQLTGYLDGIPQVLGSPLGLSDPIAGINGAFALLVALHHRWITGEGQHIDLSQNEALSCMIGHAIMEYTLNGRVQPRQGNRHPFMVPHGCYRCQGDDMWVAIAVASDEEWESLCQALGNPAWTRDERFSDAVSRRQNQDELDRLIEEWTSQHDHHQVMHLLQGAGIAAGAVLTAGELLHDPALSEYYVSIEHSEAGTHPYYGMFFGLSQTPGTVRLPPPTVGQRNEYVLGELLGLSRDDIAQLAQEQIIGTRPIL